MFIKCVFEYDNADKVYINKININLVYVSLTFVTKSVLQ